MTILRAKEKMSMQRQKIGTKVQFLCITNFINISSKHIF